MKKFLLFLIFITNSSYAHESILPHDHSNDNFQLTLIASILVLGAAVFAVTRKKA